MSAANGYTRPIVTTVDGLMSMAWMDDGRCRKEKIPTAVFFYDGEFHQGQQSSVAYRNAKRLAQETCLGCDVRTECFLYSVVAGEQDGVWGGVNGAQRRKNLRGDYRRKVTIALQSGHAVRMTGLTSIQVIERQGAVA